MSLFVDSDGTQEEDIPHVLLQHLSPAIFYPYKTLYAKNLVPARFRAVLAAVRALWQSSVVRFLTDFCPAVPQKGPYGFSGAKKTVAFGLLFLS